MPLIELPAEVAAKMAAFFQHGEVPETFRDDLGLSTPAFFPPYMFCHFERSNGLGKQPRHAPFSYRCKEDADLVSVHEGDVELPPGYAQAEVVALRSDGIEDHAVACEQACCALRICPESPSGHIVLALRGCSSREEAVDMFQKAERCARASIPPHTWVKVAISKRAWSEPIMRPLLRSLQGQVNVLMRLKRYGDALGAARRLEALDTAPPHTRNWADWGDPWAFMPELLLRVKGPQAAMQYMFRHPLADKLFTLPSCELPWLMISALSYHMLHPDARGAVALMRGDYNQYRSRRQACQDGGALAVLMRTNYCAVSLVSGMDSMLGNYSYTGDVGDASMWESEHDKPRHAMLFLYHTGDYLWNEFPGAMKWLRTAISTICLYSHMSNAGMANLYSHMSNAGMAKPQTDYSKELVEQALSVGVQATDDGDNPEGPRVRTLLELAINLQQEEDRVHACRLLLQAGAWDGDIIERAVIQGAGVGVLKLLLATRNLSPDDLAAVNTSSLLITATLGHFREMEVILRTCHKGPHASLLNKPRTNLPDADVRGRQLNLLEFAFLTMLKSDTLHCYHLGASYGMPCKFGINGRQCTHAQPENREKVDFDRCVRLLCDYGLVPSDSLPPVLLPVLHRLNPSYRRRAGRLMELVSHSYDIKQRSAGGVGDTRPAATFNAWVRSERDAREGDAQRSSTEATSAGGGQEEDCEDDDGRMQFEAAVCLLLEDPGYEIFQSRLAAILHELPGPARCCWWCARPSSPSSSSPALYMCGACMCATYCSAECQRKDWLGPLPLKEIPASSVAMAGHKINCMIIQAVMTQF